MARVKRGVTKRADHKKILSYTKGHRGTKSKLQRRARESMFKALAYSYAHRRERKGDMRRLWITRINAAAREVGTTYAKIIAGFAAKGIEVNRKMLADLAVRDLPRFKEVVGFTVEQGAAKG